MPVRSERTSAGIAARTVPADVAGSTSATTRDASRASMPSRMRWSSARAVP